MEVDRWNVLDAAYSENEMFVCHISMLRAGNIKVFTESDLELNLDIYSTS
jgi:hypothetical protein